MSTQASVKKSKVVQETVQETVQESVQETLQETVQETESFSNRLATVIRGVTDQVSSLKLYVQELKKLQREHIVLLKEVSKRQKKVKAPRDYSKPRRATGFAEPLVVSKEMYSFLTKTKATMKDPSYTPSSDEEYNNWPRVSVKSGTPVSRTDITSHISKYIKEHNLQNPTARREILPDASLKKLFGEPTVEGESSFYTYLKLQRYLNHHFKKTV
jgi:hypothetical protein